MNFLLSFIVFFVCSLVFPLAFVRLGNGCTSISTNAYPLTQQEMENVQGMFLNFSSQKSSWIKNVASGVMIHLISSLIDTLSHQAKLYLHKEKIRQEKIVVQNEKQALEIELVEMRKMIKEKTRIEKKTFSLRDF